jgi:hypothetical protein
MVHDLREFMRIATGREASPTAVVIGSRTLRGTPESGHRDAYDGAKRKKGSKVHIAVDKLGHLLARHVARSDKQYRSQVWRIAKAVQKATDQSIGVACVDQG